MSLYSSAIAERLNVVSPSDSPNSLKILRPANTTYNVARLGLVSPARQIRAAERAIAKPPSPYGKGTYKLSHVLLARLRARATANGTYQYAIVTEALEEYLDRSEPAPPPPVQDKTDTGRWRRLKRVFVSRFRPVRRTSLNKQ